MASAIIHLDVVYPLPYACFTAFTIHNPWAASILDQDIAGLFLGAGFEAADFLPRGDMMCSNQSIVENSRFCRHQQGNRIQSKTAFEFQMAES